MSQDLETECLKHGSMALQDIGLTLLKHISSHRGLTYAFHAMQSIHAEIGADFC